MVGRATAKGKNLVVNDTRKQIAGFTIARVYKHLLFTIVTDSGNSDTGTIESLHLGDLTPADLKDVTYIEVAPMNVQPNVLKPFTDFLKKHSKEIGNMSIPEVFEEFGTIPHEPTAMELALKKVGL